MRNGLHHLGIPTRGPMRGWCGRVVGGGVVDMNPKEAIDLFHLAFYDVFDLADRTCPVSAKMGPLALL